MPGLVGEAARPFFLDPALAPNRPPDVPLGRLRAEVSGQPCRNMFVGRPHGHPFELLYGWVVHARFVCGAGSGMMHNHAKRTDGPLHDRSWRSQRIRDLETAQLLPQAGAQCPSNRRIGHGHDGQYRRRKNLPDLGDLKVPAVEEADRSVRGDLSIIDKAAFAGDGIDRARLEIAPRLGVAGKHRGMVAWGRSPVNVRIRL